MAITGIPVRRAALPVAAAALALTVGAAAEITAVRAGILDGWLVALYSLVGVTTVLAGLVSWLVRPDSGIGPLMVAMGGLWFLGDFGYASDDALVDLVGFPLQGWQDVLLVVLLLAVSPGGLSDRAARAITVGMLASHAVLALARLLLRPPNDLSSCLCVPNRITGITDPSSYDLVVGVASVAEAGFAIAALGLLVPRWARATGPARRTTGALLLAGVATAVVVTYNRVANRVLTTPQEPSDAMIALSATLRISIPLAVAASLVRGQRSRRRVADVVLSLDDRGVEGGSDALRRALADPSVRLLRFSPERQAYLDANGDEAALPVPGGPLAATALKRDDELLGALVHDEALRQEPELLDAVAAAARLALHNERLADEVRARLVEVQASRQRIVEASDAERRRLERDLHDGAQQRLVAAVLRVRSLERRAAGGGDVGLADALEDLAAELDAAMLDIRELARGIRPPALNEAGLATALETLADRSPVPVVLDVHVEGRFPEVVEATAFFAASEALANVLKYADARHVRLAAGIEDGRLWLSVEDDGRGGADPAKGSGLAGLADRLDALDGSLVVESPPAGGTVVSAHIPLDVASAPGAAQPSSLARR